VPRPGIVRDEESNVTELVREIPGAVGVLEARLDLPEGTPRAVAVIGHPHPLLGGTMHTKAVYQAAKALAAIGVAARSASTFAASD
jgi:alpha/beta superfamily hydrolase